MNERQTRMLGALMGVAALAERTKLDPTPPLWTQMRTRLERSIARIAALEQEQDFGRNATEGRTLTLSKENLLRRRMRPLARIARPLLRYSKAEQVIWTLPHVRADAKTIGRHALAMVKALKPHRKLLAAAGYPATFLAELERDASNLVKGDERALKGRAQRSRATRELKTEFKRGAEAIQVMDGLMAVHAPANQRSAFDAIKRPGKKIGRPRKPRRRRLQHAAAALPT